MRQGPAQSLGNYLADYVILTAAPPNIYSFPAPERAPSLTSHSLRILSYLLCGTSLTSRTSARALKVSRVPWNAMSAHIKRIPNKLRILNLAQQIWFVSHKVAVRIFQDFGAAVVIGVDLVGLLILGRIKLWKHALSPTVHESRGCQAPFETMRAGRKCKIRQAE